MSDVTTPSELTGLFKQIYADNLEKLIPECGKLVKMIPMSTKQLGDKYNQPVVLTTEQGVTYATYNAGAFDLDSPISMGTQNAEVVGRQMLLRSAISYSAFYKNESKEAQFIDATSLVVENMMESLTKRLEVGMLHGQTGIGAVATGDLVDDTGGFATVQLTDAEYAAGIWAGAEGVRLTFISDFDPTTISAATNINPVTTGEEVVVVAVDTDAKTITIKSTGATIAELETASTAGALKVFYKGTVVGSGAGFSFVEMEGLSRIFSNTGTLFNINATNYNLWKANTYSAGNAKLTMAKVQEAVAKAVNRGLDEKVVLLVSPMTWADLAADLAALRRYDGSYTKTKGENGVESLVYHSANGEIEVISHTLVKEGEAFIFPPKRLKRIGASDITFQSPNNKDDRIFLDLPNKAGYELRAYSNQSIFVETPARCVLITGIVNG